jgi:hypothetical protein
MTIEERGDLSQVVPRFRCGEREQVIRVRLAFKNMQLGRHTGGAQFPVRADRRTQEHVSGPADSSGVAGQHRTAFVADPADASKIRTDGGDAC